MKALIDFSLFQYKCIKSNKGSEIFTYKTDENSVKKINQELFDFLKQISETNTILKTLFNKKNDHEVKSLEKRNLIIDIFKDFGYKDEFIDQKIGNASIYQTKTKSERRLFFILENKEITKKEKIIIIKPLFLDINHVIYNNPRFQKIFNTCLICWKTKCTNEKVAD
ncbi:hypothetical protein [Spiroplasma platyhelix]|uniref:Uncharacterized protein n=1 Tax=Spiroplasma platyhelix PALS-1 TaxID=1276218 RepID=A0A846TWI7_9MOLU|nr:hypothetical protein [Spiroplasma platyhelix]MBE4704009.1 hypothetical protein [Spiroplasma platyhelix PALS-1]NKE38381.1 hypothetical protein [Spiroplasma platyhelix PALS-1]UJB29267.1 hypothetical protein SPLAT_v1c05030 [Spiroplasma platyhelix PALS-1]